METTLSQHSEPFTITSSIKPSVALRLGCLRMPQMAFRAFFTYDQTLGHCTGACATGAMALGALSADAYQELTRQRRPYDARFVADCLAELGVLKSTKTFSGADLARILAAKGLTKETAWYLMINERFTLFEAIMLLNDSQVMTREEIADWLEGQGL